MENEMDFGVLALVLAIIALLLSLRPEIERVTRGLFRVEVRSRTQDKQILLNLVNLVERMSETLLLERGRDARELFDDNTREELRTLWTGTKTRCEEIKSTINNAKDSTESDSFSWSRLDRAGVTGESGQSKWRLLRTEIRDDAIKHKRWGKFFERLNSLLGSVVSGIPAFELVKQWKEQLHASLKSDEDLPPTTLGELREEDTSLKT